jgi:hypothetical protein
MIHDNGQHCLVMLGRVMFGVIVSNILGARGPIDMELVLLDSVLNPIKPHIHCVGSDLSYVVVGNPAGGGIVNLYGGGRLAVPHFFEGDAEADTVFTIKKEGNNFGFPCGGHDSLDAGVQVHLVVGGGGWLVCSGRSFRRRGCGPLAWADMRRHCGCAEHHLAGFIPDGGTGVRFTVV